MIKKMGTLAIVLPYVIENIPICNSKAVFKHYKIAKKSPKTVYLLSDSYRHFD